MAPRLVIMITTVYVALHFFASKMTSSVPGTRSLFPEETGTLPKQLTRFQSEWELEEHDMAVAKLGD